jgi:hypothetical protein
MSVSRGTYGVLIPGSGLGQTQTYGVVKPVNMNASGNMNAFYISCFFFIFYCIDRFYHIMANKSKLINKTLYDTDAYVRPVFFHGYNGLFHQ